MACLEIRLKMTLGLYATIKFDGNIKKQEKCFEFMSDLDVLQIRKGDFLLGVNPKDASRATDVRNFEQEKLDEILSNALRGKYLILRIVRGDHEDSEKFINANTVSKYLFFQMKKKICSKVNFERRLHSRSIFQVLR